MATVTYRLRSNANKNVSIYVILSAGRGKTPETTTGLTINPKDWSTSTGRPKQNNPQNKNLNSELQKLETFLLNRLNLDHANGGIVNLEWLKTTIDDCFGRAKHESGRLDAHIQYIIDNAATRRVKGRTKLGISKNRINTYKTFKKIIEEYQVVIKKPVLLTEVSKPFVEGFTNWLLNVKRFSVTYSGKTIDNLKGCCLDAQSMELAVHKYVPLIESFSESDEDRYIVTLSFDELEQIRNADIKSDALKNARKWLLIGCEIGQRAGDLLKITPSENVRYKGGNMYIDLIQEKGNKNVTVGVISPHIIDIIENEFPYPISLQKLNEYIKDVAREAQLEALTEGKKFDKKTKRKVLGMYPKHELITSHGFRRSFATNYYKLIPTPIIMGITGHEKESTFLKYINRREDKDANADLFMKFYQQIGMQKV